jgi:O-acetyl-ADP-ribose deacetylase (regulator of RNase III)
MYLPAIAPTPEIDMTTVLILNIVSAALASGVVIGALAWSIATQHRERLAVRLIARPHRRRAWVLARPAGAQYRGGRAYPTA